MVSLLSFRVSKAAATSEAAIYENFLTRAKKSAPGLATLPLV